MDRILHSHLARHLAIYGQALDKLCEPKRQPRQSRISVDGEFLSFVPDEKKDVGLYIAADSLNSHQNYFEIEVTDLDAKGDVTLGLVSNSHPLDKFPGWHKDSVGYHSKNGKIYKGGPREYVVAPVCAAGDFMGCGVRFENSRSPSSLRDTVTVGQNCEVFFTKNGKEVVSTEFVLPEDGRLYPSVCFLPLLAAEVRLMLGMRWCGGEDDALMCIDSNEEEWSRLHDIRLNGAVLEYSGRGKSIIDVGLAQAKYPLDTTHHYFEIEIVDPGENCYIAIGLARKDYPKYRHPGWNKGSIAYHADDGKIFVGSGVGEPFGPPCHKGDKMGCGIIFPRDYISLSDGEERVHELSSPTNNFEEDFSGSLSESDEEEWFQEKENTEAGAIVQVFFTRNRKTIGQKDVCIPRGGFYPTVGMLSGNEKVKVDLHPLTG